MWKLCVHEVPSDSNGLALEPIEALHECRRGWPNLCLAPITDSQIAGLTGRQAKRHSWFYGPIVIAVDVVLSVVPRRSLQIPADNMANKRHVGRSVVQACRIRRGKRHYEQKSPQKFHYAN